MKRETLLHTLAHRDGGYVCRYCKRPLDPTSYNWNNRAGSLTIDHYVPLSAGGSDELDNMVLSCRFCNMDKGAKLPIQWSSERGIKLKKMKPRPSKPRNKESK